MTFSVVKAHASDIPDIVAIANAAFKDDQFIGQMMPNVPIDVQNKYYYPKHVQNFKNPHLTGSIYYKAVNEKGYVILSVISSESH